MSINTGKIAAQNKALLTREQYDSEFIPNIPQGVCTFCDWKDYQRVIKESGYWVWIENLAPYWYYHTMFVPKRHFTKEADMTMAEMADLIKLKEYAVDIVMKSKLNYPSGKDKGRSIEKFVYFHRYRFNRYDPVSGTIRPDHYHDHFTPDVDHRWDSTLDKDAYKFSLKDNLQ